MMKIFKKQKMPSLQNLTPKLLDKILNNLTFAEISQLRGLSMNLYQTARRHLNSGFLELGPRLITKYTQYLLSLKTNDRNCKSSDAIFRGRFLRLLGSEHGILLALCRHYITNGKGCFSPGEILDLFIDLERDNFSTKMQREENKKLARLLLLIDQYLDWFERFRMISENEFSWYGTCVVDVLDSYLSSSYNLVATHDDDRLVKLSGRYVMKGQSEIPPKISVPLGDRIRKNELLKILKYLRKHVRWTNFIKSFRNDTENIIELEEDSLEEIIYTSNNEDGYQRNYKRNESFINCDYDENAESLIVMVNLQCDRYYSPARLRGGFEEMKEWRQKIEIINRDVSKVKSKKVNRLKSPKDTTTTNEKESDSNENYKFNMEIKSIYPSNNVRTSCEKFVETMIQISHTPKYIFAAQTECSLY